MYPKNYIAYKGEKLIIEWYYTENGKSPALDYYDSLNVIQKSKTLALFKRMADMGKIIDATKFRSEGDQIFTFKPQPHRFLCFFVKNGKIIITNGFYKKQQKLPKNEKEKSLAYKNNYEIRLKGGLYYD